MILKKIKWPYLGSLFFLLLSIYVFFMGIWSVASLPNAWFPEDSLLSNIIWMILAVLGWLSIMWLSWYVAISSKIYEFHDDGIVIRKPWSFYKRRFYSFKYLDHMTFFYCPHTGYITFIKFSFYKKKKIEFFINKVMSNDDLKEVIIYYRTHYSDKCINGEETSNKQLFLEIKDSIMTIIWKVVHFID